MEPPCHDTDTFTGASEGVKRFYGIEKKEGGRYSGKVAPPPPCSTSTGHFANTRPSSRHLISRYIHIYPHASSQLAARQPLWKGI